MTPAWHEARSVVPLRDDEVQLWLVPHACASAWRDALLSAALRCPPSELRHARAAHGRPYVDAEAAPRYNLAHTRERALIALALDADVGVDLEAPRTVARRDALLARSFTPRERAAIAAAPDPERLLLHAWAGKEALVKAIGRGIAYGLSRVELALDARAVRGLAALAGPAAGAGPWTVGSFELDEGYLGALAWHGAARRVRGFRAGAPPE